MTNDERKQLEQELSDAFPNWFLMQTLQIPPYLNVKRGKRWLEVNLFMTADLDNFLGACLDVADSRDWLLDVGNGSTSKKLPACAFVRDTAGNPICEAIHEIPAIAAALAILEAHKLEVSK